MPVEFRIRTADEVLEAGDFTGRWLAVIRCRHADADRCASCRGQLGRLATELAKRSCHLVVAVADVAATRCPELAAAASLPVTLWTQGVWEAPQVAGDQARTSLLVVDPSGQVAAAFAVRDRTTVPARLLLDLVASAQGDPAAADRPIPALATDESLGCVDWFEYPANAIAGSLAGRRPSA